MLDTCLNGRTFPRSHPTFGTIVRMKSFGVSSPGINSRKDAHKHVKLQRRKKTHSWGSCDSPCRPSGPRGRAPVLELKMVNFLPQLSCMPDRTGRCRLPQPTRSFVEENSLHTSESASGIPWPLVMFLLLFTITNGDSHSRNATNYKLLNTWYPPTAIKGQEKLRLQMRKLKRLQGQYTQQKKWRTCGIPVCFAKRQEVPNYPGTH